jgi:hypothetical protein
MTTFPNEVVLAPKSTSGAKHLSNNRRPTPSTARRTSRSLQLLSPPWTTQLTMRIIRAGPTHGRHRLNTAETRRLRNHLAATFRHPRSLRKLHRTARAPKTMAILTITALRIDRIQHLRTATIASIHKAQGKLDLSLHSPSINKLQRKASKGTRSTTNRIAIMDSVSNNGSNRNISSRPKSQVLSGRAGRTQS